MTAYKLDYKTSPRLSFCTIRLSADGKSIEAIVWSPSVLLFV